MAGRPAIAACFLILLVSYTEVSMSQRMPLTARIRARMRQRIRFTSLQGSNPLSASNFAAATAPTEAPAEAPMTIPGIDDGAAAPAPSGHIARDSVQKVLKFLAKFIADSQFVKLIYMGGKERCSGRILCRPSE